MVHDQLAVSRHRLIPGSMTRYPEDIAGQESGSGHLPEAPFVGRFHVANSTNRTRLTAEHEPEPSTARRIGFSFKRSIIVSSVIIIMGAASGLSPAILILLCEFRKSALLRVSFDLCAAGVQSINVERQLSRCVTAYRIERQRHDQRRACDRRAATNRKFCPRFSALLDAVPVHSANQLVS
jgi:hypothetical protein